MNRDQALTATLDELRDALAEMDGWKYEPSEDQADPAWWRWNAHTTLKSRTWCKGHPHPPTMDAAHSAMPEGWWWSRYETGAEGVKWCAGPRNGFASVYVYDTGNKAADLYRLAVLCWVEEREASK